MIFTLLVLLGLGRYKIKVPHDMSQPKKVGENKGTTFSLKKGKKGKGGDGVCEQLVWCYNILLKSKT